MIAAVAFLLALGWATDLLAGPLDPALRFRTLTTSHFVIYFHQGEDALAARLAIIAEEGWTSLSRVTDMVAPSQTHVLLVDQADLANGFAVPLPYNTVYVTAAWPEGSDFIGNTDDWLRLVFTHEFTHILHLDRSGSWARLVRTLFGRTFLAFPNLFLPAWQIEGLATYYESAVTGGGRLHAGDFWAVTGEAARTGRPEPLDRVGGGLIDWPNGHAPYAYGAGFHDYLAKTYGAERFGALANATSRRFPYTASRVFNRIFGKPLGELWQDYQTNLVASAGTPAVTHPETRLTFHRFIVRGPRFMSDREVVYALRTPEAFPTLNAVSLDGSAPRALTERFLGSTAAVAADTIYFDQQEYQRNVGLYSDLYALDRTSGRVAQMTWESRLLDPDVSPDGRTLVCVQNARGRRDLAVVRVKPATANGKPDTANGKPATANGKPDTANVVQAFRPAVTTVISEPDTQFGAPRWSPDGRTVAVERHRRGSLSEIVLVDIATADVRVVASQPGARVVTPTWTPDGTSIIAALGIEHAPFNLFEFPLDGSGARQLTHLTGGATWPDVSPDGKTIVFVGYTFEGFDLYTIPYPAKTAAAGVGATLAPAPASPSPRAPAGDPEPPAPSPSALSTYRPWPTLTPTSWFPIVESDADQLRLGANVFGSDVLGYHSYNAAATWLASGPSGVQQPSAAKPDWQLSYAYTRWRPAFWIAASDTTSFFAGPPTDAGAPSRGVDRERRVEGGLMFPLRRARDSQTATAIFHRAINELTLPAGVRTRNRTALRASWSFVTAHTFGYSISPEDGFALGVTTEFVRQALGAFADSTTLTADARGYLRTGSQHHVVALRVAAATSTGHADMRRTFLLGGNSPNVGLADFGSDAISLLRGFGANRFAGTRVVLVNADYRLPLAWPQRGVGTWPLFVRSVHAAVFADAGHAWSRTFHAGDIKTAFGVELSTDIVAGYFLPLTATIGAAAGHDGAGSAAGTIAYFRLGRAF